MAALRHRNAIPALNANGQRDVRVGMWVGIGVGAAVACVPEKTR